MTYIMSDGTEGSFLRKLLIQNAEKLVKRKGKSGGEKKETAEKIVEEHTGKSRNVNLNQLPQRNPKRNLRRKRRKN